MESAQSEKEFLEILSELINDSTWLGVILNKDNTCLPYRANLAVNNQPLEGSQVVANKMIQSVSDVTKEDSDLETTIVVSHNLSLEQYPC